MGLQTATAVAAESRRLERRGAAALAAVAAAAVRQLAFASRRRTKTAPLQQPRRTAAVWRQRLEVEEVGGVPRF